MNKKRMISAVLAAAMLTTALVGCSQSQSSDEAEKNFNYTGTGPITDTENATVTLLGATSAYSNVDITKAPIVNKVIEDAGINVEFTLLDQANYADAISPMLASGEDLCDIIRLPDQDPNQTYIKSGLFVPLDEYLDYMPNFKAWLEANPKEKASLTAEDGHIYYVCGTNVPYNYQPCLMVNMKWLNDAGLEVPTTLDEMVEVLRYFRDHDMNGNGDTTDESPMSITSAFLPYMFGPAFGLDLVSGYFVNDDGVVEYGAYDSENYKAYLEFLNGLYEEKLLEVEYTTLTRDQIIERFANDLTGVTFDYGYQMSMTYSPALPYYDGTKETGVCGIAPLSGPHDGFYVARISMGNVFGVNKKSDNIILACKFLDYTINPDNQELYVWGIEGESYEVVDGEKQFTEQGKDSEWLQAFGINPAMVYPAYQSVYATDVLVADWHAEVDKTFEQYMRDPWPFIYSSSEESDTIAQYQADIDNVVATSAVEFITGTKDIETEFDAYIESLKALNIEQLIEIKSAQYQRYQSALAQ